LKILFSNQTCLIFHTILKHLNYYDYLKVGLLFQGFERTCKDGTLTYQTSWTQMPFIEILIGTAFWFREDLSLVNDKNTFRKHQGWREMAREQQKDKNANKNKWNCNKQQLGCWKDTLETP